ncbi:hypothetical protein FRACYDRAFT_182016 [Fragilariopsis cylindrus CCMP1102]|uniref:L domain-like protein n=1 Tax=Fragilariopsis cylindrus CCMP1102 TaxID=635003 RepID=A0A1E7FN08_9STRA|nr:hypothetical protein FRACYDRAFT_182016 [Fragilariopsis cylindrus CCMP1102]|eukprot:OEU19548.1 hypothetical protein FRACYDRAFT_182016 [Fragilariopsis cylindrus CCMP1102]
MNTTEIHHPTSTSTTTSTSISASTNTSSTNTSTTTVNVPLLSLSLNEKYNHVVIALNEIETSLRIKYHPTLIERAAPLEVDDIKDNAQKDKKEKEKEEHDNIQVNDKQNNQDSIKDEMKVKKEEEENDDNIITTKFNFNILQILDISNNEITHLPGLGQMKNLHTINLNRNWFNTLPIEILQCTKIHTIIASRNFFKPNQESLLLQGINSNLVHLKILDLQYNQKCGRIVHRERINDILNTTTTNTTTNNNTGSPGSPGSRRSASSSRPKIQILMTLWEEIGNIPGTYIGNNASCRTSTLLRSQLEPLGTVALRRRLVCDFNKLPSDPSKVNRSHVMTLLLKEYYKEQLALLPTPTPQPPNNNDDDDDDEKKNDNDNNENDDSSIDYDSLVSNRKSLYLEGTPVSQMKIDEIMIALRKWTTQTGLINKNRERPSIKAQNYMILRKPIITIDNSDNNDNKNKYSNKSRRAIRKAKKQDRYRNIWDLAINILSDIDPNYADKHCTEIAVTYGFKGSPHIDKQNCGPFYGLCMGTFGNGNGSGGGGGGIIVESSARTCININTHNKLAKIDGRTDMDAAAAAGLPEVERYSLIYYETGNNFMKPGPAVFSIPKENRNQL